MPADQQEMSSGNSDSSPFLAITTQTSCGLESLMWMIERMNERKPSDSEKPARNNRNTSVNVFRQQAEELQIKSYSAGYHSSAASVNYPPRVVKHWFGLKLGNTNGPRVLLAHQ